MSIILWILAGALSGWIASKIMNTDASMGAVENIVVGMLGSLIGGFIISFLTKGDGDLTSQFTGFDPVSLLVSILGAVVLLAIYKALRG